MLNLPGMTNGMSNGMINGMTDNGEIKINV